MAYGRRFLDVVNDVLRELREPEVATWNANDYSTLIGSFVNSCKRYAEDAHRWTMLTSWVEVPTVAGDYTYDFSGTDERAIVLDAWNATYGFQLTKMSNPAWASEAYSTAGLPSGRVEMWLPAGLNASTGAYQVNVWRKPDGVQALRFRVFAPQLDLDANDDVMLVPYRPVVEGALARARYERGEDGGISFADQEAFMRRACGDHIARDAANHAEELDWEPV